jgi:hypothetical protein
MLRAPICGAATGSPAFIVAAMAVKVAVGPAMALADRWSPERFTPNRADHPADHRAGRPGHDKARSGTGHGADRVGLRRRNPDRSGKNCGRQ